MPVSSGAALLHEFFDARWREWRDRPALDIPPGTGRPTRVVARYTDLAMASRVVERRVRPLAGPESIVAILLPRPTVAAFAAPLGILRAGAAFTSIDVSFPDARISELIRDADAAAIVTDGEGARRLVRLGIDSDRIVAIDADADRAKDVELRTADAGTVEMPGLTSSSLAYVVYTSGTTGKPKGVMIEHGAIANLVRSDLAEFGLAPGDRVAQNSSHAYDSSIEETWLALAAGTTLVVMDDEVARAGPDMLAWLEREAITVFCPTPTMLRATGCRDAGSRLPHLRLIYTGGEALTADLAAIWAQGRRLSNGYGPTETAVTSVRGDVRAGAAVTIGRPIAHVTAHVLDASLADVADGATGELCLGGACLARGYWRDPDLTATKFPVHSVHGRLYRTGDLATRAADGTLTCLGRVDAQVKIRGYRIELEEIEARLAAFAGVREAACRVQGEATRPMLAAFVVPADPLTPPDLEQIRGDLAAALPAYMVPGLIGMVDTLPRTTGGKLDRNALPEIAANTSDGKGAGVGPRSDRESRIEAALRRVARRHAPISVTANFFEDLGGDSLLAAQLITELRADEDTAGLTVRDAYEAPTIEQLARKSTRAIPQPSVPRPQLGPGGQPGLATAIQLTWLTLELVAMAGAGYAVLLLLWTRVVPLATPVRILVAFPVLGAAGLLIYLLVTLAVAVLAKRVIIGTYVPGRWPVWGAFYIRHWAVCQLVRIVPWRMLEGTVFQVAALRALGARIGRRVHIHRGVDLLQGGWDLLDLGDDVTIGQEATIRLVDFEDEHIVVGAIALGDETTVETRASIAGGASVGRGGYLTALSSLHAGARMPDDERWDGVPAAPAGSAPAAPVPHPEAQVLSPAMHGTAMVLSRLAGSLVVPTLALAAFAWLAASQDVDATEVVAWLRAPMARADLLWLAAGVSVALVPIAVTAHLVTLRLLGPVPPGVISRWSPDYLRVWIKSDLVRRAGDWLSGSLMWPIWLRAAGMRIGTDCEISTIIDVVPELVSIGPGTFFADGVYLGGPAIHRGTVTLAATELGSGVFLGNHVVIPAGASVGDDVLIGVSTVAEAAASRPKSAWFGHPPFALTRPPAEPVDRRLTHDPSSVRRINRWIWEVGRFVIPAVTMLVSLGAASVLLRAQTRVTDAWMAVAVTPAALIAAGLSLCAVVLALKWLLLGRVRPGQHALWSCWCSRWDFLYVAWGRLARPILTKFDGTLLLAWYLRATGMRIGRRVVLGPGFGQVVDPDMIEIDDDATVHALFQAHTFEDRMLKIDRVRIRRRATVGCGAVLFYGADIGEGASVAAQSVIMKHERLGAHRRYEGCPCAEVT